jgi:hypothetical protein
MASLGFFIDIILPTAYGPGIDSSSNRNEYQEYLLGVKAAGFLGLTNLPLSRTDGPEILIAFTF